MNIFQGKKTKQSPNFGKIKRKLDFCMNRLFELTSATTNYAQINATALRCMVSSFTFNVKITYLIKTDGSR